MSDDNKPKLTLAPVIVLSTISTHSIPVERVITAAASAELTEVTIIGWDANGEFYFASSEASGASTLWNIEVAKKKLLEISL